MGPPGKVAGEVERKVVCLLIPLPAVTHTEVLQVQPRGKQQTACSSQVDEHAGPFGLGLGFYSLGDMEKTVACVRWAQKDNGA